MIKITVNHEMFAYDTYHITKAFFPGEEIEQQLDVTSQEVVRLFLQNDELSAQQKRFWELKIEN